MFVGDWSRNNCLYIQANITIVPSSLLSCQGDDHHTIIVMRDARSLASRIMGREIIEQLGRDIFENDLYLSIRLVASELRLRLTTQ